MIQEMIIVESIGKDQDALELYQAVKILLQTWRLLKMAFWKKMLAAGHWGNALSLKKNKCIELTCLFGLFVFL